MAWVEEQKKRKLVTGYLRKRNIFLNFLFLEKKFKFKKQRNGTSGVAGNEREDNHLLTFIIVIFNCIKNFFF